MKSSHRHIVKKADSTGVSEYQLVASAYRKLRRKLGHTVGCNVPILGRSADLVYIDGINLVAVEFKLENWRRAIAQARDHRLAADYAYVCMPKRTLTREMLSALIAAGVGLRFYSARGTWPFVTVLEAPRSEEIWPVARSWLWGYLDRDGRSE